MNIDEMRWRLGGDEALITDLIRIFLEDYPGRRAAIESAVRERHLDVIRREAHSLKGSASHFAATGVTDAAGALEVIAVSGDPAAIDSHSTRLLLELEQLATALRELQIGRS
jgi:HPt (histidine-containing phosphotransfer) domain-containing protein